VANNLTLSVTLTGDNRQLSGTLKDAQGDVREFSTTTERESKKAETALEKPGRQAATVSDHLRDTQREARTFGTETDRSSRQASRALAQTGEQAQTVTGHLDQMRGVAVAVGVAMATMGVREFVADTYAAVSSSQQLQASLKTVTGSIENASTAWNTLLGFAAETPFTLDQSVQAFIRMQSLGLNPSLEALRSYGNTASAMGKDMMQMVEAVADATTGEFERLKEFGIRASKEGEQISFTFQGVTTTVANSANAISQYLQQIGENQFAGAMGDQMDTLSGKASNLEDTVYQFYLAIGEAGATEVFESTLANASNTVQFLTDNIDTLASGAEIMAVLIGGRVVVALANVTAAKLAATQQTIAYQLALARMAGVSGTAAAAQTALAGATRAASGAMTLLGGPVGLLVGAGGLMYMFREELGLVRDAAEPTTQRIDNLTDALNRNSVAAVEAGIVNMASEYFVLGQRAAAATAEIEKLTTAQDNDRQGAQARLQNNMRLRDMREELAQITTEQEAAGKGADELRQVLSGLGETVVETTNSTTELGTTSETTAAKASELTKATEAQADALEELHNRLRPGRREVVQLADDMRTLTLAIATGTGNVGQNIQMMGLLQQQYIEAQNDTDDLAAKTVDAAFTMEGAFDELRLNGLRRLDDGFADLWQSAIDGSQNAGDIMKRALDQTLAEMAHMAITRPIIVELQGMMGMGGGTAANGQQSGMSLQSINPQTLQSGWDTVSGWFKGGASAGSAPVSYGGTGFASQVSTGGYSGWAGNASGAAAQGTGFMANAGSMMQTAGVTYAGYQFGNMAGDAISGALTDKQAQSSWGQDIGAAVGTYFLPGIGTGIGAAIGNVVDSVFGSNSAVYKGKVATVDESILNVDNVNQKIAELGDAAAGDFFGITDTGSNLRKDLGRAREGSYFEGGNNEEYYELSAFGAVGFKDRHTRDLGKGGEDGWWDEVTQGAAQIDNMVAALARGEDEFEAMKTAVQAVEVYSENAQDLVDAFTQTRPMAAIDAMTSEYGQFVQALDGSVEEIVTRAQQGASILAQAESINDLIGDEVMGRLQGISGSGEFDQIAAGLEMSVQSVSLLMGSIDRLNLQFDETAEGALDAAGNIAQWVGGVQNLAAINQSYYEAAFSETERLSNAQTDLLASLSSVTDEAPRTVAELRAIVEAQSLNGEASQQLAYDLMALAPALKETNAAVRDAIEQQYQESLGRTPESGGMDYWFNQVASGSATLERALSAIAASSEAASFAADDAADSVDTMADALRAQEQLEKQLLQAQGNTDALRQLEIDRLSELENAEIDNLTALQTRVWNIDYEKDAMQAAEQAQQARISALQQETRAMMSAGQNIRQFVEDLQNTGGAGVSPETAYQNAEESFLAAISTIYTSDDDALVQDTISGITGIAQQYLAAAESYGASGDVYQQALGLVEGSLDDLAGRLGSDELTDIDPQLQAMIDQLQTVAGNTGLSGPLAKQVPLAQTFSEFFGGNGSQNYMYRQLGALAGIEAAIRETVAQQVEESTPQGRTISVSQAASALRGTGNDQLEYLFRSSAGAATWAGNMEVNLGETLNGEQNSLTSTVTASMIANALDFDEERYFTLNEDVAAAVARGEFKSGLHHFVSHGLQEGRQFYEGGYTGPGGKYEPAGIVHAGEVVWSQDDISRFGGVGAVESLRTGSRQLPMPNRPLPQFPALGQNDVAEVLRDLKREVSELRKENARLLGDSNRHLTAANVQRGAAATQQIAAIDRSNKFLKRMEDDKRLEAAKQ